MRSDIPEGIDLTLLGARTGQALQPVTRIRSSAVGHYTRARVDMKIQNCIYS